MIKFIETYRYNTGNKFYDKHIGVYKAMIDWDWEIYVIDDINHISCGICGGYGSPYYDYYNQDGRGNGVELNIPLNIWREEKLNKILKMENNSEYLREYRRNYYKEYYKDPEKRKKLLARMKRYYQKNRDSINQKMKEYYIKKRIDKMNQIIKELWR